MRSVAIALSLLTASCAWPIDPVDVGATVVGPAGKPVGGADVWLVTSKNSHPPYSIAAHTTTDSAGRFQFGKEVIDPLWKESIHPQVLARDREGRLGIIYIIYPGGARNQPDRIKLRDVGEVRGRVLDGDGKPVAGARIEPRLFGRMIVERK